MLKIEKVTANFRDMEKVNALNVRAFPENERRPLEPLINDESGHGEVVAFYEKDIFAGFACLITWEDISHIIYFAIEENLRGKGLGAEALNAMAEMKKGCRMIVDVEDIREGADNETRCRRMAFYARNGYVLSEVKYNWHDEDYVILVRGGNFTGDDFGNFWRGVEADNEDLTQY